MHIDRQVGGKGGARRKGEKGEKGEEVKDGVISEPKIMSSEIKIRRDALISQFLATETRKSRI